MARFARLITIVLFALVSFLILSSTSTVRALDPNEEVCSTVSGSEKPVFCTDKATSNPIFGPTGILTRVIQVLIYVAGVISVIVIIVGGFRYVVSGGDSASTKGAKDSILYALVGLVITVFAQAIVAFVLKKL